MRDAVRHVNDHHGTLRANVRNDEVLGGCEIGKWDDHDSAGNYVGVRVHSLHLTTKRVRFLHSRTGVVMNEIEEPSIIMSCRIDRGRKLVGIDTVAIWLVLLLRLVVIDNESI